MTPEQIAAMQQENATLKASNTALTAERDTARADLDKFSKERRTGDIKNLFSAIGREYKEDDADVKAFSSMEQAGFDAMAGMLRSQFKKPEEKQGNQPANVQNLFQHQAQGGNNPNQQSNGGGNDAEDDSLLKNAKARQEQFSKRRA